MKKTLSLALAVLFIIALVPTAAAASDGIAVTIEGQQVIFPDQRPVIIENRTLVPVRGVFEQLGFEVEWDSGARQAILTSDSHTVVITIGSNEFTTNGVSHTLDVPAQLIANRTMLPLRLPLESVGYSVKWDGKMRMVLIRQAVEEKWTPPAEAGSPVSMLNDLIGLVFPGPYGELEEWEFYSFDRPHVTIINMAAFGSAAEITLEPVELEYRLFRMSSGGDELLYSKPFPGFSGSLPAGTFVSCTIEIPFWTWDNITPGAYKVQLVFPDSFAYQSAGDETVHYLPIRPNMYNEFYEFTVE